MGDSVQFTKLQKSYGGKVNKQCGNPVVIDPRFSWCPT